LRGEVLVVGSDHEYVLRALSQRLPDGIVVRSSATALSTEALGDDVVVVAGGHVLEEARQVRVHPRIGSVPLVVVAPDRDVFVTRRDAGVLEEILHHVVHFIAVARHPSFAAVLPPVHAHRGSGRAETTNGYSKTA
jgi:hypothetical protein